MENGNKVLCQGKDVFERMNFLYQASQSFVKKDVILSSFYGDMLTKCSKRAVLRLGTDIKRSICKVCQSPLIPGQTASVRLKSKPARCVVWRCLTCNSVKKYPTKQGYKLWSENNEAIIQEYNYGQMLNKKHGLVEEISKTETEESNENTAHKTADDKS